MLILFTIANKTKLPCCRIVILVFPKLRSGCCCHDWCNLSAVLIKLYWMTACALQQRGSAATAAPQTCTLTRATQTGNTRVTLSFTRGDTGRPLPCPARPAGPTVWTPAFHRRPCSRSGTAASPGRSSDTVRTPGPSPRAHAPPHTRSRVHVRDRDRGRTSCSSTRPLC